MAWLTLADGTGAIECAVFPNAKGRLAEVSQAQSSLREGAFVVARGRVAQQEAIHWDGRWQQPRVASYAGARTQACL
jgi:hypothetical protein